MCYINIMCYKIKQHFQRKGIVSDSNNIFLWHELDVMCLIAKVLGVHHEQVNQ